MGRLDIMEVNAMALSNTLFATENVAVMVETAALGSKQDLAMAQQLGLLAEAFHWTDLVGHTEKNVKAGKCSATKEGREQLITAVHARLKRGKGIKTRAEAVSRLSKASLALWDAQDTTGFEACGGKLQNVGSVAKDANGIMRATRKEDTLSSIEEKRQKQFKGLHSWITNHEDDLGDLYKPTLATVNAAMTELKLVIPVKV